MASTMAKKTAETVTVGAISQRERSSGRLLGRHYVWRDPRDPRVLEGPDFNNHHRTGKLPAEALDTAPICTVIRNV